MKCITCGGKTRVYRSIATVVDKKPVVIRIRICLKCGTEFETNEIPVQERDAK